MTGRKSKGRGQPKPKGRPKTEPPPETARTPKGNGDHGPMDEGKGRITEQGNRGFDPNVNQRPP